MNSMNDSSGATITVSLLNASCLKLVDIRKAMPIYVSKVHQARDLLPDTDILQTNSLSWYRTGDG